MSSVRRSGVLALALAAAGCAAAGKSAPPASLPAGEGAEPASAPAREEERKVETDAEGGEAPAPGYGGGFAQPPSAALDDAQALLERDFRDLSRALSSGRDCEIAKKALDSMKRSASRICELNGPGDPGERCAKARERVEEASEKVRRGCGT